MPGLPPDSLTRYLGDSALAALSIYFDPGGAFTGGQFERFAGGGDRPDEADRFTSEDVVAVSLLGVRLPGRASLALLAEHRDDLNGVLADIPNNADLWEVDGAVVAPGSPAGDLWDRLVSLPGVNWVTAGKLLARKRPRLIPVYDRVVRQALQREGDDRWWIPLRETLVENPSIVAAIADARDRSGVGDDISLLRVLDVAIWMQESGQPEPTLEADS